MPGLGTPELLILLVIVVLLFGGAKLPKLARSLGQARKELDQGVRNRDVDSGEDHSAGPHGAGGGRRPAGPR